MVLLAKVGLGIGAGILMATAYTFHEGVIRVDADENRPNGSHVHLWIPATIVPMAMHFVPSREFERAGAQCGRFMPVVHAVAKELAKYPEATLVDVQDGEEHALVRTHGGSLSIDVDSPDEHVHVRVPLETIDDVARQLESHTPAA
jgi:hypothetical protein